MNEESFRTAQVMFRLMSEDPDRPEEFRSFERDWDLLPGVFAPIYTPVTELLTSWLPYPKDGSFLEIGSGTGITSVMAALNGCRAVTAVDIAAAAVENSRRNAERHGVADRMRVLCGDLFGVLAAAERFDLIFWNSDFIEAPADFVNETELHLSFFDPEYDTHRRFVREAPRHLADGGRLLLGFNMFGNRELLQGFCAEVGLQIGTLRSEQRTIMTPTTERTVEFLLLELSPASGRLWSDLSPSARI